MKDKLYDNADSFAMSFDDEWKNIPVLFLTAQTDVKQLVLGLAKLGADDYLPKPFDFDELAARVKVMVRIKQAEDESRRLNKDLEISLIQQKKAYEELKTTKMRLAETEAAAKLTAVFEKFVPKEFKQHAHHWLIMHGRYTCLARTPRCGSCIIEDLCEFKDKADY